MPSTSPSPAPEAMALTTERIGFIGAGNMGEAMMAAVIRAGLVSPGRVCISDPRADHCKQLAEQYEVTVAADNASLFAQSDVVVVAVKPQHIDTVLSAISEAAGYGISDRKRVISIAAGVRLERWAAALYPKLSEEDRQRLPLIRVMPNTPALIGEGISGMSANAVAEPSDLAVAKAILETMGQVRMLDESMMDAVTAVSGSGPAYVFYLAEAMLAGAAAVGLPPVEADALVRATLQGAVALWNSGETPPSQLREQVTSPGGTTEAAIGVLDANQVHHHISTAIAAAAKRARELSE